MERRRLNAAVLIVLVGVLAVPPVSAIATPLEDGMLEDGMMQARRWRFFTDGVMGGVSAGQIVFLQDNDRPFARMSGRVSTANRGGFIQMRLDLDRPPPEGSIGVRLTVRGNNQRYFVHVRTTDTVRPWHYYQSGFDVTEAWAEVRLPFAAFVAAGGALPALPASSGLTSVAVVAYGRDHDALIDVGDVAFY